MHISIYWIAGLLPLAAQLVFFVRWLHRRLRDDDVQRAFVRDLATNHLPHIYHALRLIAAHHGLALDEPPLIRFVEFNGRRP